MTSTSHTTRERTRVIIQHVLTDCPKSLTKHEVHEIFRSFGLPASPFHFIQLPNGDIEDGRDVRTIGGYFQDSIDIAVLCVSRQPSTVQQANLNDLIQALLMDHPLDQQPEVVQSYERKPEQRAIA